MEIDVDKELASLIEERIKYKNFESVEEYINFVLKEVVARLENDEEIRIENKSFPEKKQADEDQSNEKKVQERLKALGYLDE